MFPTSRRPVPSPAALRILRQLAYISSGTACGAAALVAEERRRRTRLAGKIVENTRKLKQHPRYAHSATTSSQPNLSFFGTGNYWTGDEEDLTGSQKVVEDCGHDRHLEPSRTTVRRVRSSKERAQPQYDALRNDELPSEVEKDYKKFNRRESGANSPPRNTNNANDRYAPIQPLHGSSRHHVESDRTATPSSEPRQFSAASDLLSQARESIALDLRRGHHERAYSRLLSFATDHHEGSKDQHQPTSYVEPSSQASHVSEADTSHLLVHRKLIDSGDLNHLVDAFLALYPKRSAPSDVLPVVLASRLLKASAHAGSLEVSTRLSSWLQTRRQLSSDHLTTVCVNAPAIFANSNIQVAADFYTRLLSQPDSTRLDGIDVDTFLVIASFLDSRGELPLRIGLAKQIISRIEGQAESRHIDQSIHDSIRILLKLGHRSIAMYLFSFRIEHLKTPMAGGMMESAEELFDSFLLHEDAENALKFLGCMENQEAFKLERKIYTLFHSCKATYAYGTLLALHERYVDKYGVPDPVYPAVCWAYAKLAKRRQLDEFLTRQQGLFGTTTLQDCQPAWAAMLDRRWDLTRNLIRVERDFFKMCNAAGKDNISIVVYNAIIRICIKAEKPSEAQKFLRQMQDNEGVQPDLTTFGHFVLSAAKSQDWTSVDRMLTMLGGASIVDDSPVDRAHLFNPILYEHVRHHEPAEIWSFVTAAVEVHGIVPNQATSNIVLESFVEGKRLDLIPRWLAYMETCGHYFEVDSFTAMRMIRRYYYTNRPSHVMMMWICRNLFNHVSEFISQKLIQLLRESIAYDMRGFRSSKRERGYFEIARTRLELLDKAQRGHVPSPLTWTSRRTLISRLRSLENLQNLESRNVQDAHLESTEAENVGYQPLSADDVDSEYASRKKPKPLFEGRPSVKREEESKLLLSLSLGRPAAAVEFYHRSVAESGLPASSYSLEMAILASLRAQRGDPAEAEELLNTAEEAGFHVASALMPLMIQRITSAEKGSDALQPGQLEDLVTGFYESMDENRIPVRHHVATTAASVLIKHGVGYHGVRLLKKVYESPWSSPSRPLDIAAMTVFWQGYAQLGNESGMNWVVNTIIEKEMRIDGVFIKVLANTLLTMKQALRTGLSPLGNLGDLISKTEEWNRVCQERRYQQTKDTNKLGNKLIVCIVKAAERESPVSVATPKPDAKPDEGWNSYSLKHASVTSIRRVYARWLHSKSGKSADSRQKTSAYRALLRRGLRSEDGMRLKFRFVDRPKVVLEKRRGEYGSRSKSIPRGGAIGGTLL